MASIRLARPEADHEGISRIAVSSRTADNHRTRAAVELVAIRSASDSASSTVVGDEQGRNVVLLDAADLDRAW